MPSKKPSLQSNSSSHQVHPQTTNSSNSDNQSASQSENVSVCVRVKPIPSSPLTDIDLDTPTFVHRRLSQKKNSDRFGPWLINSNQSSISLSPSHPIIDRRGTRTSEAINGSEGYEFKLDQVFDPYSTTSDLYQSSVQSLIDTCVKDGYNVTVFAYGQTGSGKTFTMMGSKNDGEEELLGVIPRAVGQVFDAIASDVDREYLLRVSYLEIYNEVLKDLLAADQSLGPTNRLTIYEPNKGRVHVNGIKEEVVTHPMQVLEALARGEKARHVGATDWNERSSRSHTVFTMTIESRPKSNTPTTEPSPTQISQLNLIDLAGSESAATSTARRKEGAFINKSLLALSNVISKLSTLETHIPYRDSKLTRLLQTSLSGNAKVVVICTVSADGQSVVETLSTLRFARRAKMVVTKAQRGTILDDKSALLQAYQREIMSLKAQLQENSQALSITTAPGSALAELNAEKSKAESELVSLRFERIRLQEQIEHLNRRILTSQTIQSNVRRAHSLKMPGSPTGRRIVSNQMPQPPKRNKGRVTDIAGMMGMLGIGLSTSGYVSNGTKLNDDNQIQIQREIQLEQELQQVRSELNQLKQERADSPDQFSLSGIDLLKKQIRALDADKENLPVGTTEQDERINAIQVLQDEIDLTLSNHQLEVDSTMHENEKFRQIIPLFQTQPDTQEAHIKERVDNAATNLHDTQLQELKQQLEKLQNEYNFFKCQHSTLLQDSESQKSNLQVELSHVKKEKNEIASDLCVKQELISQLESKISHLDMEKDDLIRKQQEQNSWLEKQQCDANSKVVDLEVELGSLKKAHEELALNQQERFLTLETEKSESQHRIEELESQLMIESASLQAVKEQLATIRHQQQQDLGEMIIKFEKEKAEAQAEIQLLQSQLETSVSKLEKEKEKLVSNHQEQIVRLEAENSDTLAQMEELKSQLESELNLMREKHESDLSIMKEQLALMEFERSSARDQLEELKSQKTTELNNSNQAENEDQLSSKERIANLEAAQLEAETKYETSRAALETELDSLRKEKEDQLSTQQQQITNLEAERAKVESTLEELKSTVLTEMQSLLQEKADRILTLEDQIQGLQTEHSQTEAQNQALKVKFESEIESVRKEKEESFSSQKERLEKLEAERCEVSEKVNDLIATLDSERKSNTNQELCIAELNTQLSDAKLMIDDLTGSNNEKERRLRTSQDRISALENELHLSVVKATELTNESLGAAENVKKVENDSAEQLRDLETELVQLKLSLAEEQAARLHTDVEFAEKSKNFASETARLSLLQAETSNLKMQLEELDQKLDLERNKCEEAELKSMQLIQERDQALGKMENLESILCDQNNKAQDNVKSVTHEWAGRLDQAERLTHESESQIVELNKLNETLKQKAQLFESETQRLKIDLDKQKTERTGQEIQQEKLERLTIKLQEDLRKMQEKEKDSMEKIESLVEERCAAATSKLHETYTNKLTQLEQSNSNLDRHIKTLESHLGNVGNGQSQQTTAESMETIVDLQSTIEDQNGEIRELKSELENIKTSLSARPVQPPHNQRFNHDHYHQSTEDELNRLYHIIDEQEKRLSDAKTDLSKWQARVRSQTEIISKLKITSESDSESQKLQHKAKCRSNSSLDYPLVSQSARNSTTFNNLNCRSPTKPFTSSLYLASGSRASVGHMFSSSISSSSLNVKGDGNNSPRPLPVPESFMSLTDDEDAQRRKNRRRTIEKDMARLKNENVVERKLNSLLSSSTFKDPLNTSINSDHSTHTHNKFKTTMPSSTFQRHTISSSSDLLNSTDTQVASSSINNHPSSSLTGFKNYTYKRQSGPISPTASTFTSKSSQRGYYE